LIGWGRGGGGQKNAPKKNKNQTAAIHRRGAGETTFGPRAEPQQNHSPTPPHVGTPLGALGGGTPGHVSAGLVFWLSVGRRTVSPERGGGGGGGPPKPRALTGGEKGGGFWVLLFPGCVPGGRCVCRGAAPPENRGGGGAPGPHFFLFAGAHPTFGGNQGKIAGPLGGTPKCAGRSQGGFGYSGVFGGGPVFGFLRGTPGGPGGVGGSGFVPSGLFFVGFFCFGRKGVGGFVWGNLVGVPPPHKSKGGVSSFRLKKGCNGGRIILKKGGGGPGGRGPGGTPPLLPGGDLPLEGGKRTRQKRHFCFFSFFFLGWRWGGVLADIVWGEKTGSREFFFFRPGGAPGGGGGGGGTNQEKLPGK